MRPSSALRIWQRAGALPSTHVEQTVLVPDRRLPMRSLGNNVWSGRFPLQGEGQYRVDDETAAILNDLDGQASQAVESGDEKTLNRLLAQMASVVREKGERLDS